MKPRYYPHVTILGAVIITIAPLCVVLSLSRLRANADFEVAIADSHHQPDDVSINPVLQLTVDGDVGPGPASNQVAHQRPSFKQSNGDTRVAMRPVETTEPRTLTTAPWDRAAAAVRPDPGTTDGPAANSDAASSSPLLSDSAVGVPEAATSEDAVPIPMAGTTPIVTSPSSTDAEVVETETNAGTVVAATAETAIPNSDRQALEAEMNNALAAKSADRAPSYFESTGHLAMIAPANAQPAGQGAATLPTAGKTSTAKTGKSLLRPALRKGDETGKSSSVPSGLATKPAASAIANGTAFDLAVRGGVSPWPDGGDGTASETVPVLEDVILQQPLESRRVNRVEPVVAVTQAKGWPIALIRSDLPDDLWWVQQMVGIRGNAFAAKVNFGNDDSIPGSVYHMVIVFLDSADEVRRFRIAKQFKELPEGTRRSREFTFVRQ